MADDKKSFVVYSDWYGVFKEIPDDLAGKLIKHIFSYVNDENPQSDDFMINALFSQIKNTLKRDLEKWESQKKQRSNAGKRSAEKRNATKTNDRSISLNETERKSTVNCNMLDVNVNDFLLEKETKEGEQFQSNETKLVNTHEETSKKVAPKKVSFKPPDVSEVQTYCTERQNGIDAQEFCDFYASKGWMVGRNKMKDWQACVRTWEKYKQKNGTTTNGNNSGKISGRATISSDYIHPEFT